MTRNIALFVLVMAALCAVAGVSAQKKSAKKPAPKKVAPKIGAKPSPSESSLVGVRLYDSGTRIVALFGSPTTIEAVAFGGSGGAGPSGGGGAPGPGRGGGGGGMNPTGGAAPPGVREESMGPTMGAIIGDPFRMGTSDRQLGEPSLNPNFGGGGGAPPPGGGGKGGGGGGVPGSGGTSSSGIIFTRWVYNRGGSQYGFVFDKYNRVVQIEAIGIADGRVRSRKGIAFGSSFSSVIKQYHAPEAYEINSDNIMLRYLQRYNVAFRLSKLKPNGPHQVTGVVVAAGSR